MAAQTAKSTKSFLTLYSIEAAGSVKTLYFVYVRAMTLTDIINLLWSVMLYTNIKYYVRHKEVLVHVLRAKKYSSTKVFPKNSENKNIKQKKQFKWGQKYVQKNSCSGSPCWASTDYLATKQKWFLFISAKSLHGPTTFLMLCLIQKTLLLCHAVISGSFHD